VLPGLGCPNTGFFYGKLKENFNMKISKMTDKEVEQEIFHIENDEIRGKECRWDIIDELFDHLSRGDLDKLKIYHFVEKCEDSYQQNGIDLTDRQVLGLLRIWLPLLADAPTCMHCGCKVMGNDADSFNQTHYACQWEAEG